MTSISLSADALRHCFLALHHDPMLVQALGLTMVGQGSAQTQARSEPDKRCKAHHCHHHGQPDGG